MLAGRHGPRTRKGRRSSGRAPLWVGVAVLVLVATGSWWVASRHEAHLHELHTEGKEQRQLGEAAQQVGGAAQRAQQQQDTGGGSGGGVAPADSCVAQLTKAGLLPDVEAARVEGAASLGAAEAAAAAAGLGAEAGAELAVEFTRMRRALYAKMGQSLTLSGLQIESGNTQGMGVSDLFKAEGGKLTPLLEHLEVPVRAIVMPLLDPGVSQELADAVKRHLQPLVAADGIWLQDSHLYHSTIYHASTHLSPVPATAKEVEAEAAAVVAVGDGACPLHVVLERVVATSSGTVLACWQVVEGTDPVQLRAALRVALPAASQRQVVQDQSILHTTLARLVTPPQAAAAAEAAASAAAAAAGGRKSLERAGAQQGAAGGSDAAAAGAAALHGAVDAMTRELCGTQAVLGALWYAEESDKLALALGGAFTKVPIPLQCIHR